MTLNPFLRRNGFAHDDRVVLLHADDIGMCRATVDAFADLFDFGIVKSCSVMTPCAHFEDAARWCREHADADVGVHLTLTSEWPNYRWRPVSTRDNTSGLLDEDGFFHRDVDTLWSRAEASAALTEVKAQLERARVAGIEPTHFDCHMYACLHPAFIEDYLALASEERLPAFVPRDWRGWDAATRSLVLEHEEAGMPVFDNLRVLNFGAAYEDDPVPMVKKVLSELPPGLSCVLLHPAKETDELRAVTPAWRARVADYRAFMCEEVREHLCGEGIQLASYRMLRDAMRGEACGLALSR